jgi:Mg2+ and Co2+ transporter CorA
VWINGNKTRKTVDKSMGLCYNRNSLNRRDSMLILKERVLYKAAKLYIEYTQKGDITLYTLVIDTHNGEQVSVYAHDSKKVIDFMFDSIVAELNNNPNKVVDVNYIIKMAYE